MTYVKGHQNNPQTPNTSTVLGPRVLKLLDAPLGEHYYISLGEPVSFTYWAPGQPGVIANIGRKRLILDTLTNIHLVEEDCVLLKFSESGHWHDYPCVKLDPLGLVHENYPYVCEYSRIFFLFYSF